MTKRINIDNYMFVERQLEKNCKADRILLEVNIVFGMPSKSCQHLGICKIEPINELKIKEKQRRIKSEIILESTGSLIFQFRKNRISDEVKQKHFSFGKFQILEAFELPNFVESVLKIPFRIEAGIYPVTTNSTFYKIYFHKGTA